MGKFFRLFLPIFAIVVSGCAHIVEFNPEHYTIKCQKYNAGIVVVIDDDTLNKTVVMRSPLVGYAHTWHAKPGQWLKQIADTELSQMFKYYEFYRDYKEPEVGNCHLTLKLTVPNFTFYRFHANISVCVTAYCENKKFLFQKTYTKEGKSQGAKMFWGGPFAMKSAVRFSSLDAYKQILSAIREDLKKELEGCRDTS